MREKLSDWSFLLQAQQLSMREGTKQRPITIKDEDEDNKDLVILASPISLATPTSTESSPSV